MTAGFAGDGDRINSHSAGVHGHDDGIHLTLPVLREVPGAQPASHARDLGWLGREISQQPDAS